MRTHGLQGAHLRRDCRHGSTRQDPNCTAAPDRVEHDLRVAAPNRLWVAELPNEFWRRAVAPEATATGSTWASATWA